MLNINVTVAARAYSSFATVRSVVTMTTITLALAAGAGCADVLDLPDSPRLASAEDRFECGPQVDAPRAMTAHVSVHLCDFFDRNCTRPVVGSKAVLCERADFGCSRPVATGIVDQENTGDLSFDVKTGGAAGTGFNGFLMVLPPAALCTDADAFGGPGACALTDPTKCDPADPGPDCMVPLYNPGLLYFEPPITNDVPRQIYLSLLPTVGAVKLVRAAGATSVDPALGSVIVTALDCDGRPASGVSFSIAEGAPKIGTLYNTLAGVPQRGIETDETGMAGLLGVPQAFVNISAHRSGDGLNATPLATARIQVLKSTIAYVTLSPSIE